MVVDRPQGPKLPCSPWRTLSGPEDWTQRDLLCSGTGLLIIHFLLLCAKEDRNAIQYSNKSPDEFQFFIWKPWDWLIHWKLVPQLKDGSNKMFLINTTGNSHVQYVQSLLDCIFYLKKCPRNLYAGWRQRDQRCHSVLGWLITGHQSACVQSDAEMEGLGLCQRRGVCCHTVHPEALGSPAIPDASIAGQIHERMKDIARLTFRHKRLVTRKSF